jgi:hypothetical protein
MQDFLRKKINKKTFGYEATLGVAAVLTGCATFGVCCGVQVVGWQKGGH